MTDGRASGAALEAWLAELLKDPPGYPGAAEALLEAPPVFAPQPPARSVWMSDASSLLNPALPEAYGGAPPRRLGRPGVHCFAVTFGADGRVSSFDEVRGGERVTRTTVEWGSESVRAIEIRRGLPARAWTGFLAGGRLEFLCSAGTEPMSEWFKFEWDGGRLLRAARRVNRAADFSVFHFEHDVGGLVSVSEEGWRRSVFGLDRTAAARRVYTRRAPKLRLPSSWVDVLTAQVLEVAPADGTTLFLVDDEEPALPPVAVHLDGAPASEEDLRRRISSEDYRKQELVLPISTEELDAYNTTPGIHRAVWAILREAAARLGTPSRSTGVVDPEVSRLDWASK